MATKDGLAQIWYADSNGNVTGYTENAGEYAGTIIDAYNEHFGTDISIWTPETETLQVGDTVPNWSAYEKITLDILNVKFNGGFFGQKVGDKLYIATSNGSNQIIVDMQSGLVGTLSGPVLDDQKKTYYLNNMRETGHEVSEVISETLSLSVGDEIEGWNEYILIDG